MKASVMTDLLLFIGGVFVILAVMSTVFGRGIAYSILGYAAESEPAYIQDELRTFAVAAIYTPGDFEAGMPINAEHNIRLYKQGSSGYISVEPQNPIFEVPSSPSTFPLGECHIESSEITTKATKLSVLFIKKYYSNDECYLKLELGSVGE